jgi:molecular chaperone DnaJ
VTVPAGTQPGTIVPIAGQGLPRYWAPGRGSLNAVITVRLPQTLTLRQHRLYEQLREQDTDAENEPSAAAQP